MGNDIKGQQTQNLHPPMAEIEQSLNRKLPYARPIITKLELGPDEISNNLGYEADGNFDPFLSNS